MTIQVPFFYERYGHIKVEAATIDDAIHEAEEKLKNMSVAEMDACSEYLCESENIDYDGNILCDENIIGKE